jgi:peptidyl-prolyl cis-trans isomerase D
MLQILRKKAQSTFIQIIVVVIALVFIFWGVGTNMSGSRQAALKVNGEEISFQEFQNAYDTAYQQLSDQFGGNVPKGLAESFGIKQQVINQLIQTALLRQGAKAMGVHISGTEISQYITDMVQFQENGVFDMDKYKSVLAANRMAPTKFESSMRIQRLSEVAAREIGNFSATTTDFEIQDLYGKINEQVSVKFVKFSPEQYRDKVVVDDEQLQKWFESTRDNYLTDPQIKLKYLPFTYENIAGKIDIDDEKIKQYYQDNSGEFTTPEQRRARHILFTTEEGASDQVLADKRQKAAEILAKAREGADFEELAKTWSEGPSRETGGDLGYFSRGQLVPPFEDAVFAMQVGQISDVVQTRFGFHIILLEAVSGQIRKKLQLQEADSLAFQVANSAYEAIIGAGSLARYAESNPDAEIKETGFFTRSTGPADLKNDRQFITKAFELKKGELSSLIKGESGYVILFAEDLKEPEIPEFESIRDRLTADFRESKSSELAKNDAESFLKELLDGKDLDALALEKGVDVLDSGMLSQNNQDQTSEFPSDLVQDAFLLSPSAPFPSQAGTSGQDFYVYAFAKREIPAMPEDPEEIKQYRDSLLQFKQQQLLTAWIRNLQAKAEITQHTSLQ